jgi:hypothetical protein
MLILLFEGAEGGLWDRRDGVERNPRFGIRLTILQRHLQHTFTSHNNNTYETTHRPTQHFLFTFKISSEAGGGVRTSFLVCKGVSDMGVLDLDYWGFIERFEDLRVGFEIEYLGTVI